MRSWFQFGCGLLALLALGGCDDLAPVAPHEPITDPTMLFMALRLDHRAVTMAAEAPYDTLRLTATPLDATGAVMNGLPAPTYRSSDTTAVHVSPDGLLTARRPATGVVVVAELTTEGNVRHTDTAMVNVTAVAPAALPARLTLDPEPPDSAIWAIVPPWGSFLGLLYAFVGMPIDPVLHPRVLDASDAPVDGLVLAFESLDPAIAEIHPWTGAVQFLAAPGEAAIVARSTAYGVAMADTVRYRVTHPVIGGFDFGRESDGGALTMKPAEITIRQGGVVLWSSMGTDTVDVKFDEPESVIDVAELCPFFPDAFCGTGDIPAINGDPENPFAALQARRFPVPGVYEFRSERAGHTGRVIVVADDVSPDAALAVSPTCLTRGSTSCR
ncbi:MAG TPA: hypothetical protein VF212_17510 [Longimicrobiales bacterium]